MAKVLTPCQKRCQDCANLVDVKGIWCCAECFNQKIEDIDDCPEGVTLEELEAIDAHAKENHIKTVARAETKKERKPRERKPDVEKETIIADTAKFLESLADNVNITNISKIIEFDIGENHYKFDLIRQRKSKK